MDPRLLVLPLQLLRVYGDQIRSRPQRGSTVRHTASVNASNAHPIALPPLAIQRKIAAILSAYDDLIENNNRRIKLLEEMAQRIYREWFVDFRYPGHEGVPLVDSELGSDSSEAGYASRSDEWRSVVDGAHRTARIPSTGARRHTFLVSTSSRSMAWCRSHD